MRRTRYNVELDLCRRRVVLEALSAHDWSVRQAASYLGIHRACLYSLLLRLGLPTRHQKVPKWGPELHNRGGGPVLTRRAG